jgi:hypothetical protein
MFERRPVFATALVVIAAALVHAPARAASSIAFAPAVNYPTGSDFGPFAAPVGTVAGDVDRDGDVDVVVADPFDAGPLLMRNGGDASFAAAERIPVGSGIGSLSVADFNSDRRLDLVARTGSEVLALIGDGNGGFAIADRHRASTNAQQQAIAVDTNRDRKQDIVTTTPTGIQVFLGRGDGTFAVGPLTSLLGMLSDVAVARFDTDRLPDLAILDAFPPLQRVRALRGNGDGTFTETASGGVGYGPEAVVAGDLNGDRLSDAITADSFNFTMSVLLTDGRGGFQPSVQHQAGNGPVSAALGDFDRDRDLDAAISVVGDDHVAVFANDRRGVFVEAGRPAVTDLPQTPVVADFDRDGRQDIAVAGPGQLSILRNIT